MRVTERARDVVKLRLELALTTRRPAALLGLEPGLAAGEELLLPLADRHLGDSVAPRGLCRGHVTAEHRQHDLQLRLNRMHRRSTEPRPAPARDEFRISVGTNGSTYSAEGTLTRGNVRMR
jgi:hypothetical protein